MAGETGVEGAAGVVVGAAAVVVAAAAAAAEGSPTSGPSAAATAVAAAVEAVEAGEVRTRARLGEEGGEAMETGCVLGWTGQHSP